MIGWQALKAMHEGAIVELGSDRYRFVHQIVVDGGPDHLAQWWNGNAWQESDGLLEAQLWSSEWEVVEPSYPTDAVYWERRYIAQYKVTKQVCDERAAQEVEYRATNDRLTRELADARNACRDSLAMQSKSRRIEDENTALKSGHAALVDRIHRLAFDFPKGVGDE